MPDEVGTTGRGKAASTLDLSSHAEFRRRAVALRPSGEPATVPLQLRLLWRILRAARRGSPLVLYSSRGSLKPDLLACIVMGTWARHRRPATVLVGEMWQPGTGPWAACERLAVRLADRGVDRYLVLSQAEADGLPRAWPLDGRKTRVRPFYFDPAEHGLRADEPLAPRARHVVAGGDSFRDYGPLIEAARRRPDVSFLLVTKLLGDGAELPPNVEVRTAPYSQYVALLRDAGVVAVPVQMGLRRSAGILTFLMAMWLGRPTVVTRAHAVEEYVEHGRTGLLVDGTPEGWVAALDELLADPGTADRLAAAGREHVRLTYTFDAYVRGILDELDAAAAERQEQLAGVPAPRRPSDRLLGRVRR